ncbi:hypothetical protein PQ796_16445 [Priestia megaterium]|uniref:hypothetical protein n=1 Tax=Priestia megaterium TaxID=1404 RepID=UPI00244AA4F0|nr:hypothetical protein [Priestia megaterium]MDH2452126.1 hypothetical protein [Priestia megaterium]MDL5151583.1 hypothetical protein [Priestia megaterium]
MKLLEELTIMEEMIKALKEESINSNCRITGFQVHKDSYLNYTKNDVCISWWECNGHQQPVDVIIRCSNQEEQEEVYSKWWQAVEIAGGKTRKAYEEEQEKKQEEKAKRWHEWEEELKAKDKSDWMKALGI